MVKESKVIIYGTGKFAEYVGYMIDKDSIYEVCAYCIEKGYHNGKEHINGKAVVGFEALEECFPPEKYQLFIAIGNNYVRKRLFESSKKKGYTLIRYVSSVALIWEELVCGENIFISDNSAIQPFVTIGDNTIIIGSKIGHHSKIGNHVLLSACFLSGSVTVGESSFLGINATVKQNTVIGNNNIIGMGSVITHNTKDWEVYTGSHATRKRMVSADRIESNYLL
ncbi:acetyltransferase [Rapidithrix thailandica]|uniref:Acetyltransferase n=1 Tax=Rapidithrix thailandica TaxID=413964 RepID=A0AAW9S3J2_9BACT